MIENRRNLRVLISEPRAHQKIPYLPYVWAVIKTWCEQQVELQQGLEWLPPIHEKGEAEALLEGFLETPPDVLGLSCYVWNWETNCRIAELVKQANPDCLVVAGGPHPPYKHPAFFQMHPYIDLVVIKDAEIPFAQLLAAKLKGQEHFNDIPGVLYPGPDGEVVAGPPPELVRAFRVSPYLAQTAYMESLTETRPAGYYNVIWETNRGCPYSCSFCDWGSNTMSKIRKFPMERIEEEATWFAKNQVGYILLADANFGILPRDPEVADVFNKARAANGFPRYLHYSPAKNNPDRVASVVGKLAESGATPVYVFAIQHTHQEVLDAIDRFNISVEKQKEAVAEVISREIPSVVQLIMGCPGDSVEKWKQCFADLMDWGFHDSYQVFVFEVLPNAPAAEPLYQEKWQMDLKPSIIPMDGTGQRAADDDDMVVHVDVLVGCRTYTRDDWVQMALYMAFVRALHTRRIVQLPAVFLHNYCGISYLEIYSKLIEEHFSTRPMYAELKSHLESYLAAEEYPLDILFQKPEQDVAIYMELSQWVYVQYCLGHDAESALLMDFILEAFPGSDMLCDVLDYQDQLLILPGINLSAETVVRAHYDWPTYFSDAAVWSGKARIESEPVKRPIENQLALGAVKAACNTSSETLSFSDWLWLVRDLQRKAFTNHLLQEDDSMCGRSGAEGAT